MINDFLEGNNSSFEMLVRRYESDIKKLLYIILNGNLSDIEDVQQNILIALYHSLENFKFKSSFKTYLYRFIKNKAIDFIRKEKSTARVKEKMNNEYKNEEYEINPESKVIDKESKEELYKYIFSLDKNDRVYILLKDIEGKSLDEICRIMKKKLGTVKSCIHRARKKLFKILKEEGYEYL